jgi:hypothetical protein
MSALIRPRLVIKRRVIIAAAGVIICGLAFAFSLRIPGSNLRNSVNSAVFAQRRVILERQRAIERAKLAEEDADVRSETLRWTSIIANLTGHLMSQRDSAMPGALIGHVPAKSRNAGHWAFENLVRVRVPSVVDEGRVGKA